MATQILLALANEILYKIVDLLVDEDDIVALGCLYLTSKFFCDYIDPILELRLAEFTFSKDDHTRPLRRSRVYNFLRSIILCPK